MAKRIGKQRGELYDYTEIWQFVKDHDVVNKTEKEVDQLRKKIGGGPKVSTIKRLMGKRAFWKEQIAAETPKEGEEILRWLEEEEELKMMMKAVSTSDDARKDLMEAAATLVEAEGSKEPQASEAVENLANLKDSKALEDHVVLEGIKVLEPKELMAMFREDGMIATMGLVWDHFKVSFEAAVYVGEIPVRITLEADK